MGKCNENGVYEPDETLSLPRQLNGWRGMGLADISLADLGSYWIWATSYQMHSGDCEGAASPLMDYEGARSPTRQAALHAASAHLSVSLGKRSSTGDREAMAVMQWLETLEPSQLDLFGVAA